MRAEDFIIEGEIKPYKSEQLTIQKAMEILNSKCSQAAAMLKKPIWRGMYNGKGDIFFADPSTGKRESQNTSNYYTLLIDSSPYMKGWPKRSASFICSTGRSYASGYGSWTDGLYAIFPFDGVKIAVCPNKDMWETNVVIPEFNQKFVNKDYNMDEFNAWLHRLGIEDSPGGLAKASTKSKVIELCNKHKVDPKNFIPILQKALAPENTGFKLLSVEEYVASNFADNEAWIGGPVVAIREKLYKKFLDAYRKMPK